MSHEHIAYDLRGVIYYVRKPTAPTLLTSLGRTLARMEQAGRTIEAVFIYPSSDGDWAGCALTQEA